MKIKTPELISPALDWAVAKALGYKATVVTGQQRYDRLDQEDKADWAYSDLVRDSKPRIYWDNPTKHTPCPSFSESWKDGGPIIEREFIKLSPHHNQGLWWAGHSLTASVCNGPTPLIAAMRCFVAAMMGDCVDIPEELLPINNLGRIRS